MISSSNFRYFLNPEAVTVPRRNLLYQMSEIITAAFILMGKLLNCNKTTVYLQTGL